MSDFISKQVLHPKNPVLLKGVNVPREEGRTRILQNGSLLYREPLTNIEVPAVRLDDIRPRLVQEASNKMSYRFPKRRGYENTNVTAFVKKDYNYGPKRENRPDRLLQIASNDTKGELPDGYVMDGGRIVLDAFDHGLRNFGNQLPLYVSSELQGHDIEDYLRRNWQISIYDLVARAPNGYYKGKLKTDRKNTKKGKRAKEWHEGPPRVGTFSMRATRFRLRAGCLSWEKMDGTAAKNQRILDVIPAQYKDPAVNSTKGWRDLNKAEIKQIKDGAMRKPQQGPKGKRAAQAKKDLAKQEGSFEDYVEGKGFLEGGATTQHGDQGAWIGAANEQENSVWLENGPEDFESSILAAQIYETNPQQVPPSPKIMKKRKRTAGSATEHFEGSRRIKRAKKNTAKPTPIEEVPNTTARAPGIRTPITFFETPAEEYWHTVPHKKGVLPTEGHAPDDFPTLLFFSAHGIWNVDDYPVEQQGQIPTTDNNAGWLDRLASELSDHAFSPNQ
ncbi:MAG: hypothetical protein ASARMPRED_001342 [Alectoria sarmentosa]|nr:MAG: hypothetical protein ASARMPRED_001342 [Alectoria sarmentosa]